MKLPRKAVIERQADSIRDTFENVDDAALAMLHGGQPRYGIAIPPPEDEPVPGEESSQSQTQTTPPIPEKRGNDILGPSLPRTPSTFE